MRTKWIYTKEVHIPAKYKTFLWEHKNQKAPLEKLIYRILTYGNFNDLEWLNKKYPKETLAVSQKHNNLKRGIKFWLEYWNGKRI